ncbi:MAG: hypothetical protein A2Y20_08290 [Firmicutes bacterium GWF2_51_9]|nr:SDR family oxidoreductase [Erysipelotrichaceae bacterium]OGS54321.1 MAG: hypothetical protein A2Y20_08290 [Firmicutes bacterium GWF2_51_9]OGS57562.1 MAG: hypothetical protein A2Y19_01580 [Firmicutes bacterium GWE2_51_13]HAM64052.1 short-chain dehydrogenase [Erysipelotrichaceae bacterium]HAO61853.1 short-chain dehydrogenase [Erysipelotrichaceae bacterium]
MKHKDRLVVITGGAQGIGKAIVDAFLREGAFVVTMDLRHGRSASNLVWIQGDLTLSEDRNFFVDEIMKLNRKVDVLVNNAMVFTSGLRSHTPTEEIRKAIELGAIAPYDLILQLSGSMNDSSSIINLLSTRAFQSQADSEGYAMAKGALGSLTHAAALSLGPKVRVNAIAPGWIQTKPSRLSDSDLLQHPVGRVGTPEDIAKAVLFLASEDAGFITGETLTIDGGMSKRMIYHQDEGWIYDPKENHG